MKFVNEFRSQPLAHRLAAEITTLTSERPYQIMEVCGGHTHTIYKHGIEDYPPENVALIHGLGCPVCVIPMGRLDEAIFIAEQSDGIFTSFGDMMRVPGGRGSFLDAKARGADVRIVYSPLAAMAERLLSATREVRCMRDATRGGVATVLNEMATASRVGMVVDESCVPLKQEVVGACEILGIDPLHVACEGRLVAIVSEQRATASETSVYRLDTTSDEALLLRGTNLVRAVVEDLREGTPVPIIAARLHNIIARMILDACKTIRSRCGINDVALSGGVFQNIFLPDRTVAGLERRGFRVMTHHTVPTNDGGISFGQAAIAAARDRNSWTAASMTFEDQDGDFGRSANRDYADTVEGLYPFFVGNGAIGRPFQVTVCKKNLETSGEIRKCTDASNNRTLSAGDDGNQMAPIAGPGACIAPTS